MIGTESSIKGFIFIFLNFYFYIAVQVINNVVLVSDVQRSDSVIHIHVPAFLKKIRILFRLLHNIEQCSLCYTLGPYWLSILDIAVCACQFHTPNLSLPTPFPLVTVNSFSKSMSLFLFINKFLCIMFFRFHINVI